MKPVVHVAPDPAAVAADFARFFAEAMAGKEAFHVALSGGSTPKLLFRHWAEEYAGQLDWSCLHFYWGDERCVPPGDEESNYGMTRSLLFDKVPVPKGQIHRIRGEAVPEAEAVRYGELLREQLPLRDGVPVFDLIILGMGDDGHTASIFPHELSLLTAPGPCAVATHPETGQQRITLTGPVLNAAATVAFLVTGANKQTKVAQVLDHPMDHPDLPAAGIRPASGDLHWFLDEAARGR
jgi:6-phosphogluconolactonase